MATRVLTTVARRVGSRGIGRLGGIRRFSDVPDKKFNDPDMEKLVVAINDLVSEISIQTKIMRQRQNQDQDQIQTQMKTHSFEEITGLTPQQSVALVGIGIATGILIPCVVIASIE